MRTVAGLGDHAVLENCGTHFDLHTTIGGQVSTRTVYVLAEAEEDRSPRDAAVAYLRSCGWSVAGDGSWRIPPNFGPDACYWWALLVPTIEWLIERSSLGTPDAVAMRARVSDEEARRVVARAKEIGSGDR